VARVFNQFCDTMRRNPEKARAVLRDTLFEHKGMILRASRTLNMSRRHLLRCIHQLGEWVSVVEARAQRKRSIL